MEEKGQEEAGKKEDPEHQINRPSLQNQIIACCICSLGSFAFGACLTWLSPTIPALQSNEGPLATPMSSAELGWAGSLTCLGGAAGMPLFNWILKNKGRKAAAYTIGVPIALGLGIKLIANKSWIILLARLLCGLGGSGSVTLPPVYASECSEPRVRGLLSAFLVFSMSIGMQTSYCIGIFLSYQTFTMTLLAFPIIFLLAFWFMPETPTFRLQRGQEEEAAKAIAWLRKLPVNSVEVRAELISIARQIRGADDGTETFLQPTREDLNKEMEFIHAMNRAKKFKKLRRSNSTDREEPKEPSTWALICQSKASKKGLAIVLSLTWLQNFIGIFAVSTYAQMVFEKANTKLSPELCSVIYGFILVIGTGLASFLMDIAGRRLLQIGCCALVFIGELTFGIYFYFDYKGSLVDIPMNLNWIPLVSLLSAVLFYNMGPGSMPFVLISEFFAVEIRDLAASLSMVFLYLGGFVLLLIFPVFVEIFHLHMTFFFFSGVTAFLGLISYIWLPETKGKTITEIQAMLNK